MQALLKADLGDEQLSTGLVRFGAVSSRARHHLRMDAGDILA